MKRIDFWFSLLFSGFALSLLHPGRRKHVPQNHETNTHIVQFLSIKKDKNKNKGTQRHLGTPCLSLLNKKVAVIVLIQSLVRSVGLYYILQVAFEMTGVNVVQWRWHGCEKWQCREVNAYINLCREDTSSELHDSEVAFSAISLNCLC